MHGIKKDFVHRHPVSALVTTTKPSITTNRDEPPITGRTDIQ
ncbi:hypothetical protein A2U01_0098689, partial [Trifolium medium]|nr:hypothetical protein [Trifolium medium]